MSQTTERIHELVDRLNRYRQEYYNENAPSVSDAVYDHLVSPSSFNIRSAAFPFRKEITSQRDFVLSRESTEEHAGRQ